MISSAYLNALQIHETSNYSLTRFELGTPPPRSVAAPKPHRHGTHDVTAYFGARAIALAGEVWGATAAALWDKADDLKAEMDVAGALVLKFTRDGRAYQESMTVRVASPMSMSVGSGAAKYLPWSVSLVAPDPRIYSNAHSNSAVAVAVADTAINDGTVAVDPIVNVTGPINAGGTIDNNDSGESLTIGKNIAVGKSVSFDFYKRTAVHNTDGLDMAYVDSSGTTWFSVAPGGEDLELNGTGTTGATVMEITTSDARI